MEACDTRFKPMYSFCDFWYPLSQVIQNLILSRLLVHIVLWILTVACCPFSRRSILGCWPFCEPASTAGHASNDSRKSLKKFLSNVRLVSPPWHDIVQLDQTCSDLVGLVRWAVYDQFMLSLIILCLRVLCRRTCGYLMPACLSPCAKYARGLRCPCVHLGN